MIGAMRSNPVLHTVSPAVVALLLTGFAAGCAQPSPDAEVEPAQSPAVARTIELADQYVAAYFERYPDVATAEGYAGADLARLPNLSPEATAEWEALEDDLLARLDQVDRAAVDGTPEAVTHDFLREVLEASIGARVCQIDLWKVSPTWTGWQSQYSYLATVQPVETAAERTAAVARARALGDYLDQQIASLRRGIERGYTAPKNNVERVLEQMDSLLASPATESPFFDPARRADEAETAFREELETALTEAVYPAIARYRDFLRDEYEPAARSDIAVAANTDGEACYRAAVRFHTSLEIGAEEIHRIGEEQMAKIVDEMREIGERAFGTSEVRELLTLVTTDPRYTFESRQAMVDYAESAVQRAEARVPEWFGIVPRADVVVVPYPEFRERSAPGAEYMSATEDRPGTYYINTYKPETHSRAGVEATAFHETYPGHHLQISIAKERTGTHDVQRYFGTSGFIEGWALYTERLADEMALYSGDVDRLGLLSNEALRAARLVVDSGMHALGWSRQEAIDYLASHTAESPDLVEAEVDRYIAVPGQATSYMLGSLEIRRLRELAESRLGDAFDIQGFHDRVLEDGAVTLAQLRRKIEAWSTGAGG
jgi:uncharacterized protein (DUF885 family)